MVPQFLENLTDEELKKEAKNEAKNDALSMIIKSLKNLCGLVKQPLQWITIFKTFHSLLLLQEFSLHHYLWPQSCDLLGLME